MEAIELFKKNVRAQMKQQGKSQAAVASSANMHRSVLSKYLSGAIEPSVPVIERIARALDTTAASLLSESGQEPPPEEITRLKNELEARERLLNLIGGYQTLRKLTMEDLDLLRLSVEGMTDKANQREAESRSSS